MLSAVVGRTGSVVTEDCVFAAQRGWSYYEKRCKAADDLEKEAKSDVGGPIGPAALLEIPNV